RPADRGPFGTYHSSKTPPARRRWRRRASIARFDERTDGGAASDQTRQARHDPRGRRDGEDGAGRREVASARFIWFSRTAALLQRATETASRVDTAWLIGRRRDLSQPRTS